MKISKTFFKLIFTLLLLLTILPISTRSCNPNFGSNDFIDEVCSRTTAPKVCEKTLRQDHRSVGASTLTLAQIMVDASDQNTKEGERRIRRFTGEATDHKVKDSLRSCNYMYLESLKAIRTAKEALRTVQPELAAVAMRDVVSNSQWCEAEFPAGQCPLHSVNSHGNKLARVAASIARMV